MTDLANKIIWESMQERIERIQKRQALIPRAKQLQKELVIMKMQLLKLEERPLDKRYADKRTALSTKSDELKALQSVYRELAMQERETLKENLEEINRKIGASVLYDLDLEDYRSSLEQSINALKDEINQVLDDKYRMSSGPNPNTDQTHKNGINEND